MNARPSSPPVERAPWLVRAWNRYRPTTGWAVFLLALTSAELLPLALVDGEIVPGVAPAIVLALGGTLLGWFGARRKVSGAVAASGLAIVGIVASLAWGVNVLRPGLLVQQLWRRVGWIASERTRDAPPITFFTDQWTALRGYGERVGWWLDGVIAGPGAPDNLVVIGLAVFLVWCTSAWMAWWIARRGQPFVAHLPAAVLLAQHAYWAPSTLGYVLVMIAILTFLLVMAPLTSRLRAWDALGVDYAEDIRMDGWFAALALAVSVTILSPALPFFTSREFSERFWRVFESPLRRVEEQVSRSFQVRQPVRSLVPPTGAAPGGLPRAHLLGGSPELGEEPALAVRVRGDTTGVLLYWRGQTYATYTGHGWEDAPEAHAEMPFAAGQEWDAAIAAAGGRRPIVAAVEVFEASRSVVYGLGEPVGVDRPYSAILRAPGELVALTHPDASRTYTVLSHVPVLDPDALRTTGAGYPAEITAQYLQLPGQLDPRLAEQLSEWTEGSETPFDAATGIERGLRTLPYSLDVPAPPPGQELVSWFLHDLKTGYCDYYATAMVVLARLRGIPARLAIGYATGSYDAETGLYSVTELNAHSWPELYFPGIGWVPFEPTAGLPLPVRVSGLAPGIPLPEFDRGPEDMAQGVAQLREAALETARMEQRQAQLRFAWTATLALALLWAIALRAANRSLPPLSGAETDAYARFVAGGTRIGRVAGRGETPREYARGLAGVAAGVAGGAPWRRGRAMTAADTVRKEGFSLVEDVERRLYAPDDAPARATHDWRALRRALGELWIVQRMARLKRRS